MLGAHDLMWTLTCVLSIAPLKGQRGSTQNTLSVAGIGLLCLALPCLALPCLALPCLALPCVCARMVVMSALPGVTYMPRGASLSIWLRVEGSTGSPVAQSTSGFSAVLFHEDRDA